MCVPYRDVYIVREPKTRLREKTPGPGKRRVKNNDSASEADGP